MGGGPRTAKARSPGPPCCAPAVRAASRWRCAPGGRRRGALAAGKNPGSQREVGVVWKEVRSKPPEGFHPKRESQGRGSREEDGVFLPSRREAGGVGEASLWRDGLERTGCFWAGEGVWGVGGGWRRGRASEDPPDTSATLISLRQAPCLLSAWMGPET